MNRRMYCTRCCPKPRHLRRPRMRYARLIGAKNTWAGWAREVSPGKGVTWVGVQRGPGGSRDPRDSVGKIKTLSNSFQMILLPQHTPTEIRVKK